MIDLPPPTSKSVALELLENQIIRAGGIQNYLNRDSYMPKKPPTIGEELLMISDHMRIKATAVGPMHGLWDIIFDIESLVASTQTILHPAEILQIAWDYRAKEMKDK